MFRMRGVTGEVRYGYQPAARLGTWTMENDRLDASVAERNEVWLDSAGPFSLWLHIGPKKAWVWRDISVITTAGAFACRVSGKPEVRDLR